ncbi:MAG: hypothetical protein ACI8S6_000597 [Myxococcota bacterium]|jgi:hypothetical protein
MYVYPSSDRLPHEPLRVRWSTGPFAVRLLAKGILVAALGLMTLGLWPLFLVGVGVWGWPPHAPRLSRMRRYLGLAWTERPPPPGIAPLSRAWLTLMLLQKLALVPVVGLAWYLDEVLFGRRLDGTPIKAPLILLSAARSGSTQISHYLTEDPRLAAPSVMQIVWPYLWLWRIVAPTLGRVVPHAWPHALMDTMSSEEFIQRHEGNPYQTDTFEILYFLNNLHMIASLLGPRIMAEDFVPAGSAPHNHDLWNRDFVDFIDRLGRKTLLHAGPQKRLYFKGHFLDAGDALAQRYPDAHFLTVIRDPLSCLGSMLNHWHGNVFDEALGAVPWSWITACGLDTQITYCDQELAWFTREEGPGRTVIRFKDFVADLEGTMLQVYRSCMGDETLPEHVPTEHAPRERKKYRVNRSLDSLGIDRGALEARLRDYQAWCQQETV